MEEQAEADQGPKYFQFFKGKNIFFQICSMFFVFLHLPYLQHCFHTIVSVLVSLLKGPEGPL